LAARRASARALARLCLSAEILGTCDAMVDLAAAYAGERRQFDRPVGSFQAVQHLLAEAEVERRGLEAAVARLFGAPCTAAVVADGADTAVRLLKALAGRSAVRIARRSLQALGATGFTWENDLHRYARRALTLDALYGTGEQLARATARQLDGGVVPRWPVF
ncbi:MAG: acyl-CoA dehydrogenase family protein, partial [Acidimicrobiales bacterium]